MSDRILIIDDDPDGVEMLERFLADAGSDIRSLTDSKLFERAFKDFEPDLVLLDLHMPDPDGLELLRRIRSARDSLGYLPVIVLTGDGTKAARNTALILGADDFLTKPLDRNEVALRARNLLRTRRLYVELAQANENLKREPEPTALGSRPRRLIGRMSCYRANLMRLRNVYTELAHTKQALEKALQSRSQFGLPP